MKPEKVIPDRPEFECTVAEALARMRAPAAMSLWAVRFQGPLEHRARDGMLPDLWALRAWRECPRPDWLIEVIALSEAYKPGSDVHRRVVRVLCHGAVEAMAKLEAIDVRLHMAADAAFGWAAGAVQIETVVRLAEEAAGATGSSMGALAMLKPSELTKEQEHESTLKFGAAVGAFYAATTVFTASAASTAAMAISLALDNDLCSPTFVEMVRLEFPSPPPEMVPR